MKGFNKKKYGSKHTEKTNQGSFRKEKKSKPIQRWTWVKSAWKQWS